MDELDTLAIMMGMYDRDDTAGLRHELASCVGMK